MVYYYNSAMPTINFTLNSGECVTLFYIHENPRANKTLFFLHGLGTTHESWQMQIEYFSQKGYQVLAPDLPGFGKSQIIKGKFSPALVAACVNELLSTLSTSKVTIIGHSMGGPLAMTCCLKYPSLFERCILINTFVQIRLTNFASAFAYVKRFILANLQDAEHQAAFIAHKTFPGEQDQQLREMFQQQILEADKAVYRDAVNYLAKVNLKREIQFMQLPSLVISGLEDQTISPVLQHELMRFLPNAIEVNIKNGYHGMIFSQYAVINSVMNAFLDYEFPSGNSLPWKK
jgi:pimeloyl-ACP methyl ester carboxylesterase